MRLSGNGQQGQSRPVRAKEEPSAMSPTFFLAVHKIAATYVPHALLILLFSCKCAACDKQTAAKKVSFLAAQISPGESEGSDRDRSRRRSPFVGRRVRSTNEIMVLSTPVGSDVCART